MTPTIAETPHEQRRGRAAKWQSLGRFLKGGTLWGQESKRNPLHVLCDDEWTLQIAWRAQYSPKTLVGIERIRKAVSGTSGAAPLSPATAREQRPSGWATVY